jgi:uncharacterized membrane protein YhaH (DUF805 family)
MDWNWFLFSFDGRISRAQCWFAAFIWFAANFFLYDDISVGNERYPLGHRE